jgi:hypothetical protein
VGIRLRRGNGGPHRARGFLAAVEREADELVRAVEAVHRHGRAHGGADPRGGDVMVPGGMFTYQVVVRNERVYIVQITCLRF